MGPSPLGRRPRLLSLRTTFAVSFATVTAVVTVLVGVLSYNAAARLVRVDQETVFAQVVQDLRAEVRERRMSPGDFASSAPGHEIVRPARTDVQVLGPGGRSPTRPVRGCRSPTRTGGSRTPPRPGGRSSTRT